MKEVGVVMPIRSLYSEYSLGNIGESSYNFIDFLAVIKAKYWEIPPVNITSFPNNPYNPISIFGMDHNYLDFSKLKKSSFILNSDLNFVKVNKFKTNIDYYNMSDNYHKTLRKAFLRGQSWDIKEIRDFREKNSYWVSDFALYMTLEEHFNDSNYMNWELSARYPDKKYFEENLKTRYSEVYFWYFLQYNFSKQWKELKKYAGKKEIELIGEMTPEINSSSCDMWVNPKLFIKRENSNGYAKNNWREHEKDEYRWWIERFKLGYKMFDKIKLNIKNNADEYFKMISVVEKQLGKLSLILTLEDEKDNVNIINSDYYTTSVYNNNLNKKDFNSVVYTSSQENSLNKLYDSMTITKKNIMKKELGGNVFSNINWLILEKTFSTNAKITMISLKDIIRKNTKILINSNEDGKKANNWNWRMGHRSISSEDIKKLTKIIKQI